MLKGDYAAEQSITAKTIWTLSFNEEVCKKINEYPDMKIVLDGLRKSQDKEVVKNVTGALLVMEKETTTPNTPIGLCF